MSKPVPTVTFDSLDSYLRSLGERWPTSQRNSLRPGGFSNTSCYDEAWKLATEGWPEGLSAIASLTSKLSARLAVTEYQPTVTYDVVGDSFDAGAYLQGDPECFASVVNSDRERTGRRNVRIASLLCVPWNIEPDAILRRGAAIVALIDSLERVNIRCEVTIIDCLRSWAPDFVPRDVIITVKALQDPLQLDMLAFSLAHASMLRRLAFHYRESKALPEVDSILLTSHAYGRGDTSGDAPVGGYDILVPTQAHGDPGWQQADLWVRQQLRAQGVITEERG